MALAPSAMAQAVAATYSSFRASVRRLLLLKFEFPLAGRASDYHIDLALERKKVLVRDPYLLKRNVGPGTRPTSVSNQVRYVLAQHPKRTKIVLVNLGRFGNYIHAKLEYGPHADRFAGPNGSQWQDRHTRSTDRRCSIRAVRGSFPRAERHRANGRSTKPFSSPTPDKFHPLLPVVPFPTRQRRNRPSSPERVDLLQIETSQLVPSLGLRNVPSALSASSGAAPSMASFPNVTNEPQAF